jgi:Fe-S-cluster containining protein
MSMGCARGCGDCCDPVFLAADATERADWWKQEITAGRPPSEGSDADFISKHWHEEWRDERGARYRCDFFDPNHRECTAHDQRPGVCSGFPWYGEEPTRGRVAGRCSYQWDLPGRHNSAFGDRPLLPIEPVRRG